MGEQKNPGLELAEVARELRRHVRWAQGLGETHLPAPDPRAGELSAPVGAAPAATPARAEPVAAPGRGALPAPAADAPARGAPPPPVADAPEPTAPPGPSRAPLASPPRQVQRAPAAAARLLGADGLHRLRADMGDCRRCKLCEGRQNLVFGVGNPQADLVFVGEGPGADEDLQGEPFVGKAGQLLTKMIGAMGLAREQVYICNVVKCRPPGNRNPEPDEIAACEPFLQAQLVAIQPKAIVALGRFAAQTLLRSQTPITRLRGRWHEYQGVPLMPTFHPAYLLRSPAEKAKAWEDLKLVMARLGMPLPQRR